MFSIVVVVFFWNMLTFSVLKNHNNYFCLLSLLACLFKKISLLLNTLHCTEREQNVTCTICLLRFVRSLFNQARACLVQLYKRSPDWTRCSKRGRAGKTHIKFLTQGKQTFNNNINNKKEWSEIFSQLLLTTIHRCTFFLYFLDDSHKLCSILLLLIVTACWF